MKKLVLLALSLVTPAAFAYQYVQCEAVDNQEQTSFVLALGHQGENTLYIASPLLYPATERSELITVTASQQESLQLWAGTDKLYSFNVRYDSRVNGTDVDAFGAVFEIVGARTHESLAELPMSCFARVHAE